LSSLQGLGLGSTVGSLTF